MKEQFTLPPYLFRVWDNERRKMTIAGTARGHRDTLIIGPHGFWSYIYDGQITTSLVEGNAIMLWTGMGDMANHKIFAGDILEADEDGQKNLYIVTWGGDYPAYDVIPSFCCEYNRLQHLVTVNGKILVIGDIYKNPEIAQKITAK